MALRLEEPKPCPPGRDTPQRQVRYWRSASPAGGPVWVRYVPGLGEARHRSETVKFVAGAAPVVLRRRAVLPRAAAHPHHGRRAGRVCARPTGSLRRAQRPTPHSMSVASNGWRRPAVVCPRRQIYADLDRHRQQVLVPPPMRRAAHVGQPRPAQRSKRTPGRRVSGMSYGRHIRI